MKRLVYAENVKEQIDDWLDVVGYCTIGKNLSYYGELLGCIEDAPTIEAVPVVHGHWIYGDWDKGGRWIAGSKKVRCSKCWRVFDSDNLNIWHWCPQCGAKMDKPN